MRSSSTSTRRWDTSIDAGKVFAAQLKAYGVRTRAVERARAATRQRPCWPRCRAGGWTTIVKRMLLPSDNDYAEALHRLVALRMGYAATWSGAAAAQRKVLRGWASTSAPPGSTTAAACPAPTG